VIGYEPNFIMDRTDVNGLHRVDTADEIRDVAKEGPVAQPSHAGIQPRRLGGLKMLIDAPKLLEHFVPGDDCPQ